MKKLILASAALMAGLLASVGAQATTFNFSYSFDAANTGNGAPVTITGSFDGDLVGSLISQISDAKVWINGTAFGGPLLVGGVNSTTGALEGAAVISTDVAKSNFAILDGDSNTYNNLFTIAGGQAYAINYNLPDALGNPVSGAETATNAHWTVTAAAVPEPASYALMAAGLVLIGATSLRRRKI
ncbi:PEP-CTERM sorting domain-containing protein [Pelomonas sp. KK5]|uniref:PEP-CTERM sorting domain-containing protein n=1 Tax=Pelomonas sp. KK5 TaxID=1855730 RepID=UPI001302096A|nr:PEP-CTERM sorting domain-containing protein [Pelomonas sp. KK5]